MKSRREFLTNDIINMFKDTYRAFTEEPETDFFSSYELCYAILAEASLEELQNDARTLGIDPAGKSKYELARIVYKPNKKG